MPPRPGETTVVASSTMGYGCVVPPFVQHDEDTCGVGQGHLLTQSNGDDPALGPPGRYHLVGRWRAEPLRFDAWLRARDGAVPEGTEDGDAVVRVLELRDWCVEWTSIPAAYREPSVLAPDDAAWRRHRCDA